MSTVWDLAKLYFLGKVRRQVHLATLFLSGLLLMLPAYVNAFSLGISAFERVSKDFGLTLIAYFGIGMAILLSSSAIPRDAETRALYPILARPLFRVHYILAHYLATVGLLAASFLFLGASLSLSLSLLAKTLDLSIFISIYASFLQSCVIAACCQMVSTVASPALAGTVGAFVFLVGSLPGAFIRFFLVEDRGSQFSAALATGLKAMVPNLSLYALKDPVVHELAIPAGYLTAVSYYAVIWVVVFITGASILFGRRDL